LQLLEDTLNGLQTGLVIAIVVIFLMLAAYYQSFALSAMILAVVPAVIAVSLMMLLAFGSTLNLQSYMGMIMSLGVSVSNAFLMVDYAEKSRFTNRIDVKRTIKSQLTFFSLVIRKPINEGFAVGR
jgi:multidrug efflux pump subunit AcrB